MSGIRNAAEGLLEGIVTVAHDAIAKTGVKIAAPASMETTVSLLNDAWARFWRDPAGYAEWESSAIEALRASLGTSRP
jgi:hypothetical protein